MSLLPVLELGHGPGIVLLHGVGVGPASFAWLAALLAEDHRVLVIERPGLADRAVPLAAQAESIAETMHAADARDALIVGVSGGATLALLLGIERRDLVGGLVLHEPLVGSHAPGLQRRFIAAAHEAQQGDEATIEVVRGVFGADTWSRMALSLRIQVAERTGLAREEIAMFAAFSPSLAQLATLRDRPLLTTIGEWSGPERQTAAEALVGLAGASLAVVPGCGNAAHLDAPVAFAEIVRTWAPHQIGCRG